MSQKNDFNAIVTLSAAIICLSGAQKAFSGGQTCVQNYINSREFCFKWSQGTNPIEDLDFEVDFTSDASKPDIDLLKGDLEWEIWAIYVDNGNPAPMGDITTTDSDNYVVKIANGSNAGASTVDSLVLDPAGDNQASIAAGSEISYRLFGDLTVVADSGGAGGAIDGLVIGDAAPGLDFTGNITAEKCVSMTIKANVLGDITIDEVESLAIEGDIEADIVIDTCNDLTIDGVFGATGTGYTLDIETLEDGALSIDTAKNLDIEIANLDDGGKVRIPTAVTHDSTLTIDALGSYAITTDVVEIGTAGGALETADIGIHFKDHLNSNTHVNLENADLTGWLVFTDTGVQKDVNGDVTIGKYSADNWTVMNDLNGTFTVNEMNCIQHIYMLDDLNGTININGATDLTCDIRADGGMSSTGRINIEAGISSLGNIMIYGNHAGVTEIGGDVASQFGSARIGVLGDILDNASSAFEIKIHGTLDDDLSLTGDVAENAVLYLADDVLSNGTINVGQDLAGEILVDAEVASGASVTVDGNVTSTGSIVIYNDHDGLIDLDGDHGGEIRVSGAMTGDIDIANDIEKYGEITIDENMTSTASILVGGYANGAINIGADVGAGDRDLEGLVDITGDLKDALTIGGDLAATGDILAANSTGDINIISAAIATATLTSLPNTRVTSISRGP